MSARITRADIERKASVVRELMRLAASHERAGAYDSAAQAAGQAVNAALELSKTYTARAEQARGPRPQPGTAPCPHCGSTDVDRGATGLDECKVCGGLSRAGAKLREAEA